MVIPDPVIPEVAPQPEAIEHLSGMVWNHDYWGNNTPIYDDETMTINVTNYSDGEVKYRSDWFTVSEGVYAMELSTAGTFADAELLIEERDTNGNIAYHSTLFGTEGTMSKTFTLAQESDISILIKLKNNGTLTINHISFTANDEEENGDTQVTSLTFATGEATGYGDEIIESQKDVFAFGEDIHFGVTADVDTSHTWRIEVWHDGNFWWGQDSSARNSQNHSFHSLIQTTHLSGTYTFKIFLDTGEGLEYVGEKNVDAN